MNKPKQKTPEATTRFHNHPYRAEVSRPDVRSTIIKIIPKDPDAPSASRRQVAAFLHELAAEMEKRSEGLRAEWSISVEAWSARIQIELMKYERKAADELIAQLVAEYGLA